MLVSLVVAFPSPRLLWISCPIRATIDVQTGRVEVGMVFCLRDTCVIKLSFNGKYQIPLIC